MHHKTHVHIGIQVSTPITMQHRTTLTATGIQQKGSPDQEKAKGGRISRFRTACSWA